MVGHWLWIQGVLAQEPVMESSISLTRCSPHPRFAEAFCGHHSVPEDRSKEDGRQIKLNIMMVPSVRANAKLDPIFVFAGGPGQGAVDVSSAVMPSLLKMNQQRTIVFIDQRGTGESNPLIRDLSDPNIDKYRKKITAERQNLKLIRG